MSFELKSILNSVADENNKRERMEFEEGINRYNLLLQKIAVEKKLDIVTAVEGIEHRNEGKMSDDLEVLEKAHLVAGETKYTHRNTYLEYTLTPKGADLAEKLSKEQ